MKLYIANHTCSLTAQIIAHEIGLPLDIVHVNVLDKTTSSGENYMDVNRHGYVPTLILDNSKKLSETIVVSSYLADMKPEARLLPPNGTFERVKLTELLTFIATEIHQKYIPVFREYVTEYAKNKFREILIRNYGALDDQLSDGRPYLTGNTFTVADAYLYAVTLWHKRTHVKIDHLKNLAAFMARVEARSSVQAALHDEAQAVAAHQAQIAAVA